MNEETRRAIAHAALTKVTGKARSSIYSYDARKHTSFSGNTTGAGYDYDARAHISASGSGLYHYGQQSHINLSVRGKSFSGYDYGSRSHFSGSVNGNSVQLYDYGEQKYFQYS